MACNTTYLSLLDNNLFYTIFSELAKGFLGILLPLYVCLLSNWAISRVWWEKSRMSSTNKRLKTTPVKTQWKMDMSEQIWTSQDKSGHVWTCLDMSGHVWTCLDMSGHVWTCLDKSGQVWTSLDKSGQVRTSLDKSGHVWTCLDMSRHVCTSLDKSEETLKRTCDRIGDLSLLFSQQTLLLLGIGIYLLVSHSFPLAHHQFIPCKQNRWSSLEHSGTKCEIMFVWYIKIKPFKHKCLIMIITLEKKLPNKLSYMYF